ncbi:MAG: hypothetical protein MK101_07615 [Phycisphaerales bacterium]|nr:hypothetical protein [Phycisphaerales bacterium]
MACELVELIGDEASTWPVGVAQSPQGCCRWLDVDLLDGDLSDPGAPGFRAVFSGTPGEGRFDPDPTAWMAPARAAFKARLAALDRRTLVRPHHAHVLSDVPGTRSMLEGHAARPVALDVAAIMSPSMLADPEPHLDRILHGLGNMAGAVLITDARPDEQEGTVACSPGCGQIPGAVLARCIEAWLLPDLPADVTIAVPPGQREATTRWLGWL